MENVNISLPKVRALQRCHQGCVTLLEAAVTGVKRVDLGLEVAFEG